MTDPRRLIPYAVAGLLLALPAAASDVGSVAAIGDAAREQAGAELQACGEAQGVALGPETSFLTEDESTMVFKPVAGIEVLKREDLVNWTVVGMFTAAGPADTEVPSGTYRVEVRADLGTTSGEFQIVDKAGVVVQSGELTIDTDPDAEEPGQAQGVAMPFEGKGYYYGTFYCPWYYPYFYPYYFRYWPVYKHGCYRWYYRWWWGYLHWRFCWWPSRYCVHCRHYW